MLSVICERTRWWHLVLDGAQTARRKPVVNELLFAITILGVCYEKIK